MARPFGTKNIESPEKMWEHFTAYREWVEANPIKKHVFVGKEGTSEYEKRDRPLTMEGFENYCFEFLDFASIDQYFSNEGERYGDYVGICSRIRRIIRANQIEGGMAGIFVPSITQRLNGLVEKQEQKTEITGKDGENFKVTLNLK